MYIIYTISTSILHVLSTMENCPHTQRSPAYGEKEKARIKSDRPAGIFTDHLADGIFGSAAFLAYSITIPGKLTRE